MAERRRLALYTIPAHRAFADALVAGLIRRFGGEPLGLARGMVLLPNNRSKLAVTQAFVRASGGALLLPRLVVLGDVEAGEASAAALDPADDGEAVPPAVDPLARRMMLARLVQEERTRSGRPVDAAEAVRLAGELARTLDQLIVEDVSPRRLRDLDMAPELSTHWQTSLDLFNLVIDRWPEALARLGRIDAAERRARLLRRMAERWRTTPPEAFVCAAGISDPAPAVAQLLRSICALPNGLVVLAGLGTALSDEEWDMIGPHAPDPVTGRRRRSIETHPQFQLKRLIERMGVARGEFATWRDGSDLDASVARGRAIAAALAPPELTARWADLKPEHRRLAGVTFAELATPAEEAQAIALALREALEVPGQTAALVTPDRGLARRVAALCRRWEIAIDDSAGRPLSILPPGTLLTAILEAVAQDFAPLALMTLLKHPLVQAGGGRATWLDGVRLLDRALRGPRCAPGLAGVDAFLTDGPERERRVRAAASAWWPEARALLTPIATTLSTARTLTDMIAALREAAAVLAGDAAWAGPAGRAAADLLADLESEGARGPADVAPDTLATLLGTLMDEIAVRPQHAGNPRLAIYGQIEARLQSADVMVLAGLNEGAWPSVPSPDPWLAPRIRAELGLAGLEQRIGIAAHDFGQALGAPRVLVTRSRRDARGPAIASRLWLRLEALAGERFERARDLEGWTRALDAPGEYRPADRPAPVPARALRPIAISVTEVDRLKADPYAFYARRVLKLMPLDAIDADPSAAWRGTAVHGVLEAWAKEDDCAPDALRPRALAMLDDPAAHPLLRALWQPRLIAAIDWIADRIAANRADGRDVLSAEGQGRIEIGGVTLSGRYDRIDRLADGTLGIIDYKTGKAPSATAVRAGYSQQLGLLGLIAERGGFDGLTGTAAAFEYWSMARDGDGFGKVTTPVDRAEKYGRIRTDDFTAIATHNFIEAAGKWLTGDEPFTAKLVPEYAPYADYDQLMRRDEWYGRDR